jgi:hypothetical protein
LLSHVCALANEGPAPRLCACVSPSTITALGCICFFCVRVSTLTRPLSTSFHPHDDAPNDARRAPTVMRRSTLGLLNSVPNRRQTPLDTNVRYTMRVLCAPRVILWMCFFAKYVQCWLPPSPPSPPPRHHSAAPMRVIHPLSPPLCWAVSRAFIFSHLPPSPCAPHPRARPYSGAQINALRAQPDAQPDTNAPVTKVRHRALTRAVPPFSLIMCKPTATLLLLLLLRFVWCVRIGTSLPWGSLKV